MDLQILKVLCLTALFLRLTPFLEAQTTVLEPLLRDPSRAEWSSLSRFSRTLTRGEFEQRLREVFDPFHGLDPFLEITNSSVKVFAAPGWEQLVEVQFASSSENVKRPPVGFRTVSEISRHSASKPLVGFRLVIEPADIGGKWGGWDDRSTFYRGYGRIQEGDLNLTVAKILERNLQQLGAKVFLTRQSAEPVAAYDPQKLEEETRETLARQATRFRPRFTKEPGTFRRTANAAFRL